ncbi:LOW QUALITY PROTEIN: hypothetical protein U9M48_037563 [Paspalum notatum var. saurae]|uniref:Uncharacterized protein n=1 Tax=Paspalum notatum var. saurae TaxID=547442 RepID=A0AAQ3UF59_PASNO
MCFFKACVFNDKQTWEGHNDLHDVGWEIVKRLKGFPLAVKTVGNVFPIAPCFPEDYEFGSEELIPLWIGLGFLGSDDQNKRIEDIGLLNDLVSHGFFQKDKKEDGHTYYVIHDLLHDLAKNVSAYDCLSIQCSNLRSAQIPASIRHMSIIIENANVQERTTFQTHRRGLDALGKRLEATNLRTLMLFGDHHGSFCKLFGDMFREATTLRVILLSGASYDVEDLLPSFSQFVHLRYLRIKSYVLNGKILAGSISRLYNLLVLDLKECRSKFDSTREMSNLVKIRHFLVRDDSCHSRIVEVGKLKSIQELRRFEVKRGKCGFELNQLGQLLQLQGSLEIHNLEKVEATTELEEMIIQLAPLKSVKWDKKRPNSDPEKEQDVLERLNPHSNLQEVCIKGHGGSTYPTWLCTDLSVKNLGCLCLKYVAWKSLPPMLGEISMVGEERRSFAAQTFENLKKLELVLIVKDCHELTELPLTHIFPNLEKIDIFNCEELLSMPQIPWTTALCQARLLSVGANIEDIDYSKNKQFISIKLRKGSNLSEIKTFIMRKCSHSKAVWPTKGENNAQFESAIERLEISNWGGTTKELAQVISYFPNLSNLELWNCDSEEVGEAVETESASLRSLSISGCPMFLSSSSMSSFCCPFPTSLQSLTFGGVKDGSMFALAPLTNLIELELYDCEGLRSDDVWRLLSQGHLNELWSHNLFDISEPSRMHGQDVSHNSRLQALETDEEAGTVAVSIGGHFSSSLTKLGLDHNHDMEPFTKAQSEALQILTSLECLHIFGYYRLRSLPEGLSGLLNLKALRMDRTGVSLSGRYPRAAFQVRC